jgi:hypothetical protein
MKNAAGILLLLALAVPAHGAGTDASALAETMKQARHSSGFEARMSVFVTEADGRRAAPFKVAVIGQVSADRQRLLIHGIAPERVRGRYIAAERATDGRIRAVAYGEGTKVKETDPYARLFDSGMALWDMFGAWWSWPGQESGGTERIAGRECTLVRSRGGDAGPVRAVASCVDRDARLALKTQLFDRRQKLLRTLSVERTMRKESGALGAKKLLVTENTGTLTEIEVYAGDEQYLVTDDTFAALDAQHATGKQ